MESNQGDEREQARSGQDDQEPRAEGERDDARSRDEAPDDHDNEPQARADESSDEDGGDERPEDRDHADAESNGRPSGPPDVEALERAVRSLSLFTGKEAQAISGYRSTDDGWIVTVEMLEVERIPETTNLMGSYEATIDDDGSLIEFKLARRYVKGRSEGE